MIGILGRRLRRKGLNEIDSVLHKYPRRATANYQRADALGGHHPRAEASTQGDLIEVRGSFFP